MEISRTYKMTMRLVEHTKCMMVEHTKCMIVEHTKCMIVLCKKNTKKTCMIEISRHIE